MIQLSEQREKELIIQLESMVSESRNANSLDLDQLSTLDLVTLINSEDATVASAVSQALAAIADAVELAVSAIKDGGRLIYLGAGTSGRLGVLDAVECPPTFSVPHGLVVGVLAGGQGAMFKAVEGAEDSVELGANDLKAIDLTSKDCVVGIAASGRTPYVIGGLSYANSLGAKTVAMSCNPDGAILSHAAVAIALSVGPEVLTGSTRLKAGTAQKLALNMLSTATMVKLGKVYQNLMVDVAASNEKLYARAVRIVMLATECPYDTAKAALIKSGYRAKVAILMILSNLSAEEAEVRLASSNGKLSDAV
ncbi:N-acetylmuramic acid 6-phosphate etherase [uncultured Umboniibacter sp.]|uniref:N-acetylmuramic acid 6-phosphate etherase n=1 Tax=uncultured Umboniibacter sp. TaxID=1798917 RepID=UPI00260F2687|nr:N-acetylmuramic acid 6-phosphate etherase [uncultured Umboniibacter sp.]